MPWWEHKASGIRALLQKQLSCIDVAVVDSGIDATHPDLCGRISSAVRIESRRGGHTFISQHTPANHDVRNHGTSVAGVVARVAPNASIHDIRIFDGNGGGSSRTNMEGFRHAIERGYSIINLAVVCNSCHAQELLQLCEEANRRDIVVVAARRNVARPDFGYPAELSSCIAVGSDTFESFYEYRYTGSQPVEFVAFGRGIDAPAANNGHTCADGTSYAAAVISGMCALIRGAYPDIPAYEVKTALKFFASGC